MKKFPIILSLLILFTRPSFALDTENGKQLHDENCLSCHTTEIYTAEERKVKNMAELVKRIQQCELMTEMGWFDEEIADVAEYLNEAFYLFGKK